MTRKPDFGPDKRRPFLGITIQTANSWVREGLPIGTELRARLWLRPRDAIGHFADRTVRRLRHECDALHRADLERAFLATEKGMTYRAHPRYETCCPGKFLVGDQIVDCVVLNISVGGAKIRFTGPVGTASTGSTVRLRIERIGEFSARVVWHKGTDMGLQFHDHLHQIDSLVEDMQPSTKQKPLE